ncbi:hypothetical protein [Chitinophaga sp. 212800008-4]|uniref:hypothetical protein n=1 Tax=unclassified Chitinophaga TaxID=2619133 RepID=UPI0030CC0305
MKFPFMLAIAGLISASAFAQGPGHQRTHIRNHPRVNQVNRRIDNQERRISEERREGDITKGQAKQDRKNLREINEEKRDMRKKDRGHLTKKDQSALNQQLNQDSKAIGH